MGLVTRTEFGKFCKTMMVSFVHNEGGATTLGTSREAWTKGIPWAQARLQMQIGHARATRRTSFLFFNKRGGATGLGTSREVLGKAISWPQARLQMQIGHARATRIMFSFFR